MVSIASHIDAHRPERVPALMPARFPAWERSWQGEPPGLCHSRRPSLSGTCWPCAPL